MNLARAQVGLAVVLRRQGRVDEARELLERVLATTSSGKHDKSWSDVVFAARTNLANVLGGDGDSPLRAQVCRVQVNTHLKRLILFLIDCSSYLV